MKQQNPSKMLREKMDALRVLETSMPRVTMGGEVVGRVTHLLFTYTPSTLPVAMEEYQLSIDQVQELVGLIYDVLDIADVFRDQHAAAGSARSARKAAASRENGKKGGRPRVFGGPNSGQNLTKHGKK